MNKATGCGKDENIELLEEVIYGADMGLSACQTLLGKTKDAQMLGSINAQIEQYSAIKTNAQEEMRTRGQEPTGCVLGETGLKIGVHMNTMLDSSTSHIAEMLIEGSTMGVIDITRSQHRFAGADAQVSGIAQNLLDVERANIDIMRDYLI